MLVCNSMKQTHTQSVLAAIFVYTHTMQPFCHHRMVSVCFFQLWFNVCFFFFKSLHWLPVCQKTDFKILLFVCKALNVFRTKCIWFIFIDRYIKYVLKVNVFSFSGVWPTYCGTMRDLGILTKAWWSWASPLKDQSVLNRFNANHTTR